MATTSRPSTSQLDTEFDFICPVTEEIENEIEEIVVSSTSSEDDQNNPNSLKVIKKQKSLREKKRRSILSNDFDMLQAVIENKPLCMTRWARLQVVQNAVKICQDLTDTDSNCRLEVEMLFQKNDSLKNRLQKLNDRKCGQRRRKTNLIMSNRRASSGSCSGPKVEPRDNRRASLDESNVYKAKASGADKAEAESSSGEEGGRAGGSGSRPPRRATKKRSGLSQEEKEYLQLEEKIEGILAEAEELWSAVQEEKEEEEEEKAEAAPLGIRIKQEPVEEVEMQTASLEEPASPGRLVIDETTPSKRRQSQEALSGVMQQTDYLARSSRLEAETIPSTSRSLDDPSSPGRLIIDEGCPPERWQTRGGVSQMMQSDYLEAMATASRLEAESSSSRSLDDPSSPGRLVIDEGSPPQRRQSKGGVSHMMQSDYLEAMATASRLEAESSSSRSLEDSSPGRLVIDERSPLRRRESHEMDVMEVLQAVDTLCMKLTEEDEDNGEAMAGSSLAKRSADEEANKDIVTISSDSSDSLPASGPLQVKQFACLDDFIGLTID